MATQIADVIRCMVYRTNAASRRRDLRNIVWQKLPSPFCEIHRQKYGQNVIHLFAEEEDFDPTKSLWVEGPPGGGLGGGRSPQPPNELTKQGRINKTKRWFCSFVRWANYYGGYGDYDNG